MAKKNNHYKMKNKPKKKGKTFGKVMAYTLLPITIASAGMAGGYYLSKNNVKPTTGNVSTQTPTQNVNDQKILQLTEELKESVNKISILNTQIEELKADSEATAIEYAEEIATLEAQVQEESAKFESTKLELSQLQQQMAELEYNYNELQSNYDSAVYDRDNLAGEYGSLSQSYNDLQGQYSYIENNYNNLQVEYDNLNNEYNSLLSEFAIAQLDSQTLMGLYDGSIKELTIPDNVTTIRPYAFYGLTLDNLILPSTLTTISDNAFTGLTLNNALNISVDGNLSIGASAFAKGQVEAKKADLTLSVPNGALTFTGPATFDFDGIIEINAKTINGHSSSSYSACFNCYSVNITAETYNYGSSSGLKFNAITRSRIKFTKDVELTFPIYIDSGEFTMELTPSSNINMENSIEVDSVCPKLTIINSSKFYRSININDGAEFINSGTIECLDLQGTFQFNSDSICGQYAVINELKIHNYAVYFTGVTTSTSNIKSIVYDGSSYKNDLYKLINSNTTSLYVTDTLYDQYIADTNYSAYTELIHKLSELNSND